MSQTTLASRLGIIQSRLSAMELDPASINLEQLLALFAALNLEISVQSRKSPGAAPPSSRPEW
jgi:HTH-type transcriptional regulator/antitoxin HipB